MKVRTQQAAYAVAMLSINLFCPLTAGAGDGVSEVRTIPVPEGGKPVVAKTDGAGTIHLFYDTADGAKYAQSTDNGMTFGPAITVVKNGSRQKGLEFSGSDMAVGTGGRIHVAMSTNAWKLKLPQEEWGFYYATLSPGAKAFSPVRNLNRKPSEGFSLAADAKGNVTACWLSDKLYANVSHDDGRTFGPNLELNPAFDPCNCCTTAAAYGEDGKLAVLYREETENKRDMYLALWDQRRGQVSRVRVSSILWKVDACPMSYYAISRDREGFVAVWPTKGQIYFARLDKQGNPSTPEEIGTVGRAGMRTGMLALSGCDGTTLVAWTRDGQMGWQVYDAGGRPSGSAGSAQTLGDGVAGVVDKDGRFILFR